jgi:hypothetical protein
VDPEANLAETPYTIFARAPWIVPLEAEIPSTPMDHEVIFEED